MFDIDYMGMRLNALETFAEGEFVFANKVKVVRKYVHCKEDPTMYTHYSQIFDVTL